MSMEIKLPDVGADEVEVTEILVNVGDSVSVDQSIMTVEGDKASITIPSPRAGKVKAILVKVGDKVKTDLPIMEFESDSSDNRPAEQSSEVKSSVTKTSDKDVLVPDIGSDEVEVTEVLVNVGDRVSVDQSVMTVEGDKASISIPSPYAGEVKSISVKVGDKVKSGSKIIVLSIAQTEDKGAEGGKEPPSAVIAKEADKAKMEPAAAKEKEPASTKKATVTSEQKESVSEPTVTNKKEDNKDEFVENEAYAHATPSIRRLAREVGINLAKVTSTGPKGRILREDIQTYVKKAVEQIETKSGQDTSDASGFYNNLLAWPSVDFSKFGDVEALPLSKIQKVSGANLHRNWVMIPHVTEFDETDITDLEAFRKQKNSEAEKQGLAKVTPVVFVMKAIANALKVYPRFNSSLSEDGQKLIVKKYVNIGVAVDTKNGLVVPVFKDIDKKGVMEISKELRDVSVKAREGKLTSTDMQGGCFTISSLGGIGTTLFTPIINAPEVAILGVSRAMMKPVWDGNEFKPRLMLPLSLSFDHRVIDGADGARFLSHIVRSLSDLRHLVM